MAVVLAAIVATIGLSLAVARSADAANAAVAIRDFSFIPATVTVNVGDSVTWTNQDVGVSHSATSDTGAFDTGVFASGSRSVIFTRAGTFAYHCAVHPFMQGSVRVAGATPAPTAPPTARPTAPPTPAPTPVPTPRASPAPPTVVPATPTATATPTASPSLTPTASPTETATPLAIQASPSGTPTQAPTESPSSGSSRTDEGPGAALLAGAFVATAGLLAVGLYVARRR